MNLKLRVRINSQIRFRETPQYKTLFVDNLQQKLLNSVL